MAKTVSSAGLADFIATGKPTQVYENDQTSKRHSTEAKAKLAVVEPIKPAEPAGKEPASTTETKAAPDAPATAKTEPEDTGLEPEDHDLAERAQKRISKKHREMKTAQEEAAAAREEALENERFAETLFKEREEWRKRAEEAEKRVPAAAKPEEKPAGRPDPKDFMDDKGQFKGIEYAEALAEWSAIQAIEKDRKTQAEERAKAEKERADAAVRERIAAATQKYPDWEKKVTGSNITLQNECLQFIGRSPQGMDIAYFLADNPKEAERIRALDPYLAVGELGKLQTRFEKPAEPTKAETKPEAPTTSSAPAPITPISTSGAGSVVVDPAKMNFRQLREWHRERRKAGLER